MIQSGGSFPPYRMREISMDTFPHLLRCVIRMADRRWSTFWARLAAGWWGVRVGESCSFVGLPRFRRHPQSRIIIGAKCRFNSSPASNLLGVNRPCILATLTERGEIKIGRGCGFSGTVITCATRILLGENVRCGANTLIMDTDWHTDDPRAGLDAPVIVEKNVWLGVNVTVLKGVSIGENTLVGAGSVVTRSLPAGVIAAGNPARVIRQL